MSGDWSICISCGDKDSDGLLECLQNFFEAPQTSEILMTDACFVSSVSKYVPFFEKT